MDLILSLYALGGLILAGLSVPLVLHKMPPNGLYGIRARSMSDNPALWYKVNAYAGRRFMLVGLGTSIGSIILYFISKPDVNEYAFSCLGLFVALFLWAAISTFLHLRSAQETTPNH